MLSLAWLLPQACLLASRAWAQPLRALLWACLPLLLPCLLRLPCLLPLLPLLLLLLLLPLPLLLPLLPWLLLLPRCLLLPPLLLRLLQEQLPW